MSPHALSVCQNVAVIHSLLTELLPKTTELLQPNPGTDRWTLWAFSPPLWLSHWSQFRVTGTSLGDVWVFSLTLLTEGFKCVHVMGDHPHRGGS